MPEPEPSLTVEPEGAEAVRRWFGSWPSFHDAEVLEVHLVRDGVSRLRVHCWIMSDCVDKDGYYVHEKEAVVTFELEGLKDLELADFSSQNVLSSLRVDRLDGGWRLSLWPSWGIGGAVEAGQLRVMVTPLQEASQQ